MVVGCGVTPRNLSADPYAFLGRHRGAFDALDAVLRRYVWRKTVQRLDVGTGGRVLDIGCGTGGLAIDLKRRGFDVVGVDSSQSMLERARLRDSGISWILADAADLLFQREFDAAVLVLTLHEMAPETRERMWRSAQAAVRSGGITLVADYDPPSQHSFGSRMISRLIEADERLFTKIHPAHYRNFREWMDGGGLSGWLERIGTPWKTAGRLLRRNLSLVELKVAIDSCSGAP